MTPVRLLDYFDVRNHEHVGAYSHLVEHGVWPADWLKMINSGEIIFDDYWESQLKHRMASAWMEHVLKLEEVIK